MSDDEQPKMPRKKPSGAVPLPSTDPIKAINAKAKEVLKMMGKKSSGVAIGELNIELPPGGFKKLALDEAHSIKNAMNDPFMIEMLKDFGVTPEEMRAENEKMIDRIKELPDE